MRPRRIRVPIGVAYGTDLDHLRRVLIDSVLALPGLLHEAPGAPPEVLFTGFGASSIDLEVLVWLREPRDLVPVVNLVNGAIYESLASAEIEIPFPKRDVTVYASAAPYSTDTEHTSSSDD